MTIRPLVLALPLLLLLPSAPSSAAVAAVPTLPTSALHPGQHAVVRTVFAGDSVESFDADLMGVMSSGRAEGEIILARATSPRVVACGIAAGMSGSPVYVDGKLIGALSMGWALSKEPIFGITPIGEMLEVLAQPDVPEPEGSAGPGGLDPALRRASWRGLSWDDDTLAAPTPAAATSLPMRLPLPLAAGGLSPEALALAQPLFAGSGFLLTPGGRAAPAGGAPPRDPLEPGAAVAVDVLRGDLNFSAIGTVTYRDGDRVLIFGHPFFQAGDVRLPLSTAHIVGILPSLYDSFKLGVPGTPVGVATQDRRSAVGGHLGGLPSLMPFTVEVQRGTAAAESYHFESIEDRLLMPQLVATAALSCAMEMGGSTSQQGVRWSLTAWRRGKRFTLADLATGESPLNDAAAGIAGPLRFLAANGFERWVPDSLTITLAIEPGREQWTVRGAQLLAAAVRPGGTARVRVEVERWRGERRTLELGVPVPAQLPAGHYALWLGGGGELDRMIATRLPARFRPTSLDDAVQRLGALHGSDRLFSAIWAHAPDVTREGEDYPELPTSALALLAPSQASSERIRRGDWALLALQGETLHASLHGDLTLDLNVDDRAP